jgi:hypothetical protein
VRISYIRRHSREHRLGRRPVETQVAYCPRIESGYALPSHLPRSRKRQIGRNDAQICLKGSLGNGLIHRPIWPSTLVPIHGASKSRSIVRSGGKMVGDSFSIFEAEHFKTHCGSPTNGNQTAEHFGLQ